MIIGFWSLCHGHGKVSSSSLATSLYVANNFDLSCVLINAQEKRFNNLDSFFFDVLNQTELTSDTGLDKLLDLVSTDSVDDKFRNYTDNLVPERLDYVRGSRKEKLDAQGKGHGIANVVKSSTEAYDLCFVDIGSKEEGLNLDLVSCCDTTVVCLEQNEKYIKEFLEYKKMYADYFNHTEIVYVLSDYNANCKCTYKAIRKLLKTQKVFSISHSDLFADSLYNSTFNKYIKGRGHQFHIDMEMLACALLNSCGYGVSPDENIVASVKGVPKKKKFLGVF